MRHPYGHTLLEVFLAMILVTMIVFAVLSVYPGAMAAMNKSHRVSNAANLAAQALEETESTKFSSLIAGSPKRLLPSVSIDAVIYQIDETVTAPYLNDPNMAQVAITVEWDGTSSVTYQTVVYNYNNPP